MTAHHTTFDFHSHPVRVVDNTEHAWFVAADVAAAPEYPAAPQMTRNLDDDEKGMQIVHTPGGAQEMIVINESGLYHAVLTSRKPAAKEFRRWVTAEVLPTIRKTGAYSGPAAHPIINGVNRCNLYGLVQTVKVITEIYRQVDPGLRALKSPFAGKLHDRMVDARMFAAGIEHEHRSDMQAAAQWEADFHRRTQHLDARH